MLYDQVNRLYVYMYPLPLGPPSPQPHPTPGGHLRALSWAPRAIQQLPTSFLKSRVLKLSPLPLPALAPLALRMKIKEVKKENGDKKIVPKKKKPLKLGPIKKKELKKLVLYLKNGADCPWIQDELSVGRTQYAMKLVEK